MTETMSGPRHVRAALWVLASLFVLAALAMIAIMNGYQPPARPAPASVEQQAHAQGVIDRTA